MLETLKEKWNEILKYLKEEYDISDVSFDTWLLPLEVYALEQPGNIVKIIVPDANFLGYIKKKYSTMLMVSIAEVTGIKCDSVQFFCWRTFKAAIRERIRILAAPRLLTSSIFNTV